MPTYAQGTTVSTWAAEYLAAELGVEVKHLTPADAPGLTPTTTEEQTKQGNLF
jgi:hypothetical protein